MGTGGSSLEEGPIRSVVGSAAGRATPSDSSVPRKSALGDGAGSIQIFETMPGPYYIDRVRAHVAETGLPETFQGLHLGPIPRDEPFRILSPISVPRMKRSRGDKAPCPMCQPNKFFEGKLVYFFRMRAVAIIGHCCASAVTRNEAMLEYEAREARERAEEYLLDWVPKVPGALEHARALQPAAIEAQRVYDRFRKDGARFQQALRRAVRGGAELTVTEIIGSTLPGGPAGLRTSGSAVQTRDVRFGPLDGQVVVASTCTIAGDLEECISILGRFDCGSSEDAIVDFVLEIDDEEKAKTAKKLEAAISVVGQVERLLGGFRAFFGAANLDRISRWGAHPEAPVSLSASLAPFGSQDERVFEVRGEGRRFGIVIAPSLWAIRAQR